MVRASLGIGEEAEAAHGVSDGDTGGREGGLTRFFRFFFPDSSSFSPSPLPSSSSSSSFFCCC